MNHPLWAVIREYIAAEVKLGIARGLKGVVAYPDGDPIPALEEQSTRMETEIRRLIDEQPRTAQLSSDQLHAVNMMVPIGPGTCSADLE